MSTIVYVKSKRKYLKKKGKTGDVWTLANNEIISTTNRQHLYILSSLLQPVPMSTLQRCKCLILLQLASGNRNWACYKTTIEHSDGH